MPITHGWTTAEPNDPTADVSADNLDDHTGTNDHGHTATGDGGLIAAAPTFATPAIVLGSSAAAGAAGTVIRSDSTIAAFDATSPSTQALGDSAVVGTAAFAARRDHKHAMPALGTTAAAIGTSAGGSAATPSKSDHVHATGAGTPSTQAFGDSAATGSGPAAAMTDHKHAMMALPAIDATAAATDITTRNVSTSAHGLAPKLPNDAAKYLDGTGAYTVPAGGGGGVTHTVVSATLGADVNLTSGTLADGPAVTLTAGTWIITYAWTISSTTNALIEQYLVCQSDESGTPKFDEADVTCPSIVAGYLAGGSRSCVAVLTEATPIVKYRIRVDQANCKLKRDTVAIAGTTHTASRIDAIKIA